MSTAFTRLIVATPTDLQGTSRRELRKGVLKSTFLSNPRRCNTKAGYQPPESGLHCDRSRPILIQFPTEIMGMILGGLSPIWLLQVEQAYGEIAKFLCSQLANKIWYRALPPALLIEPEYFQNESDYELLAQKGRNNADILYNPQIRQILSSQNLIMPPSLAEFSRITESSYRLVLPSLGGLSVMSQKVHYSAEIDHPKQGSFYPLVTTQTHTRLRTLALGGPFKVSLNYRREILGHLHLQKRCYICFEILTGPARHRPAKQEWGMLWCADCLQSGTATWDELKQIPGLVSILQSAPKTSFLDEKMRKKDESHWLALVDDVLRREVGLDFETTVAKQRYMEQLSEALGRGTRAIDLHRIQLRRAIVSEAERLWKSRIVGRSALPKWEAAPNAFTPVSSLSSFLFPEHKYDLSLEITPRNHGLLWLDDPTMEVKSPRAVPITDAHWVCDKAQNMLRDLVKRNSEVSTFVAAVDKYHADRLKREVTADNFLHRIDMQNRFGTWPTNPDTINYSRFKVLLEKLHLYTSSDPNMSLLNDHQRSLAKASFQKILFSCCTNCPSSGFLALPRGLNGLIRHMRKQHPRQYWLELDWMMTG